MADLPVELEAISPTVQAHNIEKCRDELDTSNWARFEATLDAVHRTIHFCAASENNGEALSPILSYKHDNSEMNGTLTEDQGIGRGGITISPTTSLTTAATFSKKPARKYNNRHHI